MLTSDLTVRALDDGPWLKNRCPDCKFLHWTGTEAQFLEKLFTGGCDSASKFTAPWLMGNSHLLCCDQFKRITWLRKIPPVSMCFWHLVLPKGSHQRREEDWKPGPAFIFSTSCAAGLFSPHTSTTLPFLYCSYKHYEAEWHNPAKLNCKKKILLFY